MDESISEKPSVNNAEPDRRLFFLGFFAFLTVLTLILLRPFFAVIAVVLVMVVISKPLYTYLLARNWVRERTRLAASLTLLLMIMLVLIPILVISFVAISQAVELLEEFGGADLDNILADISAAISNIPILNNLEMEYVDLAEALQQLALGAAEWLTNLLANFLTSLPELFIQAIVFIVLFISLLPEFDNAVQRGTEISLLGVEISSLYYRKATAMAKSMVTGIFLIAVIEGVLMGFFFWLAGVEATLLITLVAIMFALLPVVGISYLTILAAIIFVIQGNYSSALIVLFGFYGVVNWIDIFLRPKLVSKEAYMSFALVLLGIFGGLYWAGILGLIYGPVLMILFVTTVEIYVTEYARDDDAALDSQFNTSSNDK